MGYKSVKLVSKLNLLTCLNHAVALSNGTRFGVGHADRRELRKETNNELHSTQSKHTVVLKNSLCELVCANVYG